MPKWWNWQTRRTQNPMFARTCGFKSHLRHQQKESVALFYFFLRWSPSAPRSRQSIAARLSLQIVHWTICFTLRPFGTNKKRATLSFLLRAEDLLVTANSTKCEGRRTGDIGKSCLQQVLYSPRRDSVALAERCKFHYTKKTIFF